MAEWRQGAITQNSDGRLEYFVADRDGSFRHCWQRLGASNDVGGWLAELLGSAHPARPVVGWEPWATVQGPQSGAPLAVARNADGRLVHAG